MAVIMRAGSGKGAATALGVLIADADERARSDAAARFALAGHEVNEARDVGDALDRVRSRTFDFALCDLGLPDGGGLALLRHVRRESPGTAVVVTASSPTVGDAVGALKEGATDFLVKPLDVNALLAGAVARVAERRSLKVAFEEARAQLVGRIVGAALIGESPPMRRLLDRVDGVAPTDSAVLITGESGTGKDIVARTLYARSRRAARPFVTIDCTRGADAVEDELFAGGGRLAAARGGTLFLDEVAELASRTQARLARVLREEAGLRVISATHHDLADLVRRGRYREDLYFLLNTVDLAVPPLRARKADLPLLVHHFLERLTPPGLVPPGLAPSAWEAIEAYDFPGNVRELARAIEHAMALAHGSEIGREHLPEEIGAGEAPAPRESGAVALVTLATARRRFEREYVLRAVAACAGDAARAAALLGVAPAALARKLRACAPEHAVARGLVKATPRGVHEDAEGEVRHGARRVKARAGRVE